MTRRRRLTFASLDEIMPDVERLLAGHVTFGKWSLAQICNHLALAHRLTLDGFPERFPWLLRKTIGVVGRRMVLWSGRIPRGVRVPPGCMPAPGFDAAVEAESLRAAIERFQAHTGPLDAHPLLGHMTPSEWVRFHCIHSAHHLSFASPV